MALYASLCLYQNIDTFSEERKKYFRENYKKRTFELKEQAEKVGLVKENGDAIGFHLKKFDDKEYICLYSEYEGKKPTLIHKWVFGRGWTWLFDENQNMFESEDGLVVWYEVAAEKARENLEESREHFLNKEDTDKEVVEEIYKKMKEWLDKFPKDSFIIFNEPS